MVDEHIARLLALDTCAVSDALDGLGLNGVALGLRAVSAARRIAGRAVTVQLMPYEGRPAARHLCTAAVEAADDDSVIVIANQGRTDAAGWGGILSLAAHRRGIAGVVIDGAARDIDESSELGLAVYAKTGVPVTARGRVIEKEWNVPVTIANVDVRPGDLVLADGSGVAIVARDRAEEVLAMAERIASREKLMAADIAAGQPVSQVMGGNYETMLERKDV